MAQPQEKEYAAQGVIRWRYLPSALSVRVVFLEVSGAGERSFREEFAGGLSEVSGVRQVVVRLIAYKGKP
jgi:hypothetical protein